MFVNINTLLLLLKISLKLRNGCIIQLIMSLLIPQMSVCPSSCLSICTNGWLIHIVIGIQRISSVLRRQSMTTTRPNKFNNVHCKHSTTQCMYIKVGINLYLYFATKLFCIILFFFALTGFLGQKMAETSEKILWGKPFLYAFSFVEYLN